MSYGKDKDWPQRYPGHHAVKAEVANYKDALENEPVNKYLGPNNSGHEYFPKYSAWDCTKKEHEADRNNTAKPRNTHNGVREAKYFRLGARIYRGAGNEGGEVAGQINSGVLRQFHCIPHKLGRGE